MFQFPRRRLQAATSLGFSALLMVALASCGVNRSVPPLSNTTPTTGTSSGPALRAVGARGGSAWAITSSQFFLTTDEGAHWSSTPLPTQFSSGSDGSLGSSGDLWLLTGTGASASFYRAASPSAAWSKTTVALTWPTGAPSGSLLGSGAIRASFGSSASGIVAAIVTEGGAQTGPVGLALLSSDGGQTFQQRDPPTLFGNWEIAFISSAVGVIVGSSSNQQNNALYFTKDGGASWQPATLPNYTSTSTSESSLGAPVVVGSRIYVTANVPTSSGRELELYASDDGGATFALQDTITAADATDVEPPALGVNGVNVWLAPGHGRTVVESSNGGASWRDVSAPTLGASVESIGLSGASDATAWVASSSCTGVKTDCTSSENLLATTDGGITWHRAGEPSAS